LLFPKLGYYSIDFAKFGAEVFYADLLIEQLPDMRADGINPIFIDQ